MKNDKTKQKGQKRDAEKPRRVERHVKPCDISLSKFNDCCYRISIKQKGREIESGIWCSQSHLVVIDGGIRGLAESQEEVIRRLKLKRRIVNVWSMG